MKRVTDLIIGKTYDAALDTTNVAGVDGAVNLIDIATGNTAIAGANEVVFIKKCTSEAGVAYLEYGNTIHRGSQTSYSATTYVAASPKVITLTALTAPAAVGTSYVMYLNSRENENYLLMRRRYEVISVTGETGITLADKFRVLIDADTAFTGVETDAPGAAVIVLTGQPTKFSQAYEANFELSPGENLEYVTATTSAGTPDPGCGTNYTINKFEEVAKGYKGVLNKVLFSTEMYALKAPGGVSATGYDLFAIEHKQPFHTNTEGSVPFQVVTQVAMEEGTADVTALIALIAVVGLDDGEWY